MSDLIFKEYQIHNLQKEYNKYSILLLNYQEHVKNLYGEHILTITERNNYFKQLNDLLRKMNTLYNDYMVNICDDNTNSNVSNIFSMVD